MRYIWLIFLGLVVVIGVVGWLQRPAAQVPPAGLAPTPTSTVDLPAPAADTTKRAAAALLAPRRLRLSEALRPADAVGRLVPGPGPGPVADSLVRFALRQIGAPYTWAGTTPVGGFDCSGFLMYAYAHVGVPVPHSTALLIDAGQPVTRADARPGDLVIFTGTAATSTTPGHAGLIISPNGERPMRFVHSSSARRESGVKISQVEGTDYERRFMQVRRVLGGAAGANAPAAPPSTRIAAVVAPLETRPAAVKLADETEPPRPKHLTRLTVKTAAKVGAPKAKTVRQQASRATPKKASKRPAPAKASAKRPVKAAVKSQPKTPVKPRVPAAARQN